MRSRPLRSVSRAADQLLDARAEVVLERRRPCARLPTFRRLRRVVDRVAPVLRIGSIVLRVDDLQRQTEFWEAALDYVRRDAQSDDFVLLRPRGGVGPNLSLDQVPSKAHWDERPPEADYVILSDPEGNRFCVVDISR